MIIVLQTLYPDFSYIASKFWHLELSQLPIPSMHGRRLPFYITQAVHLSWSNPIYSANIQLRNQFIFTILCSIQHSTISCLQLHSTVFCTDLSQHISYKSIKVYLAGTRLAHLELDHSDPTVDESLRLVIRGIRHLQGESCRQRLPITIDLLQTLKQHIRISNCSLVEQCLLWSSASCGQHSQLLSMAFYE